MAERKRAAPYATAGAVSAFFDHIRYVKTPDKVDSNLLMDYGVSQSQAWPLLSTLKFLGLTESDGTPTPAFRAVQTEGDDFRTALRDIIEKAYSDLFARLDVSRDSRDKIKNFFARNYSPATSERATTLFLDLCGEAGMPIAAAIQQDEGHKRAPTPKRNGKPKYTPPPPPPSPPFDGNRVVLEVRLTENDLSIMEPTDIDAVFAAAAKIEIARTRALAQARAKGKGDTGGN